MKGGHNTNTQLSTQPPWIPLIIFCYYIEVSDTWYKHLTNLIFVWQVKPTNEKTKIKSRSE